MLLVCGVRVCPVHVWREARPCQMTASPDRVFAACPGLPARTPVRACQAFRPADGMRVCHVLVPPGKRPCPTTYYRMRACEASHRPWPGPCPHRAHNLLPALVRKSLALAGRTRPDPSRNHEAPSLRGPRFRVSCRPAVSALALTCRLPSANARRRFLRPALGLHLLYTPFRPFRPVKELYAGL